LRLRRRRYRSSRRVRPTTAIFACNAALVLTKTLRRPPREIAEQLAARLGDAGGLVARTTVAGPGFLNVWLSNECWQRGLADLVRAGDRVATSRSGGGARVQVEFVSANPTGPLTLGHGRQAVIGDCIARLLQVVGHDVTREYYFNDGGRQMRVLGESVKARYLEQLGPRRGASADALADAELPGPNRSAGSRWSSRATVIRASTSARWPRICASSTATVSRTSRRRALSRSGPAAHLPRDRSHARRARYSLRRVYQREDVLRGRFDRPRARRSARQGPRLRATAPCGCAPRASVSSATACW